MTSTVGATTTVKIVETLPYPLRVVALGGGTGLPAVLRGFKQVLFPQGADEKARLTGIVTVTDEGGSSGRLREELGMLPPGDIRNCLVALSHNEPLMSRLFQARYRSGETLEGHNVGNLILAALAQEEPDGFLAAVRLASEVLNIQGRVLPSTLVPARLVARLSCGRQVTGETSIVAAGSAVEELRLSPANPPATPGVVDSIEQADIVLLGPGSLFSSIIPNVLVPEIAAALKRTRALRLLVVNAMTEVGETGTFSAADHLRALVRHAGDGAVDGVLLATDEIPAATLERYRAEGAARVAADDPAIDALVPLVVRRDLLQVVPKVRHDGLRTAGASLHALALWRERVAATVTTDASQRRKA